MKYSPKPQIASLLTPTMEYIEDQSKIPENYLAQP